MFVVMFTSVSVLLLLFSLLFNFVHVVVVDGVGDVVVVYVVVCSGCC